MELPLHLEDSSELQITEFLVPYALRAPCTRHYLMMETVPVLMEMMVELETGAFSAKLQGGPVPDQTLSVYMSDESARAWSLDGEDN